MNKYALLMFALLPMSFAFATPYKHMQGVNVVPYAEMNKPADESLVPFISISDQMKITGYIETQTNEPAKLFAYREKAKHEISSFASNTDPSDTHLKSSISAVQLAFTTKRMPVGSLLGYAAIGAYKSGWTGVVEFFEDKTLGVCKYEINNWTLSGGATTLAKENVRYDINEKPNTFYIAGNTQDGFIYRLNWFDQENGNDYSNVIKCANQKYSEDITKQLMNVARKLTNIT